MRTDGHDASRFVPRSGLPLIDHEAAGPLSALVRLATWLGRAWRERADTVHGLLVLKSRHWL